MTTSINPVDVEAGVVHHCIDCGYNLHGLDVEGVCPECGKPISESVALPAIWVAQPRWFERQLIAMWVLIGAEFVSAALWFSSLIFTLFPAGSMQSNSLTSRALNSVIIFTVLLRFGLIITVGWMMMQPNKISSPDSQENRWRRLVFPLSLACLVVNLNSLLWSFLGFASYVTNLSLESVADSQRYKAISYGISVVGIAVLIGTGIWFAVMLFRITSAAKTGPTSLSSLVKFSVVAALLLSLVTGMTATLSFALCTTLLMFWFATWLSDARLLRYIKGLFVLHVIVSLAVSLFAALTLFAALPGMGIVLRVLSTVIFFATLFVVFNIHRRARELQAESASTDSPPTTQGNS